MIRRSVWVKTVLFVLVATLGITYTAFTYLGLGRAAFGRGYTAYVDLADSGGLFTTASVTYRGVEVGRVGPITLHGNGIRVALDIDSDLRIPADTHAVVGNGSPIGEQFIDLRPRGDTGPYLQDGSVIPQSATALPVSTQDVLVNLDRLVRSVPTRDLRTLVTQLGRAFDGAGRPLRTLLDQTRLLLADARSNLPQTRQLIRAGGKVLDTQNALSGDTIELSSNLAAFTDVLRAHDADLRAVLDQGVPAATQLVRLDHSLDATLPVLLGNLTSLGQVTAVRIPALRQILVIYPYVVSTSFGLFPGNGSTRFGIPVPPSPDHQPCQQGYLDPSKRRLPSVLRYPPIRYGSFCTAPQKADINVRGSRQAPEPDGRRLGAHRSYRQNKGLPHRHHGNNAAPASAAPASFLTPDGRDYTVASTGGMAAILGDRSWLTLVFGPLS